MTDDEHLADTLSVLFSTPITATDWQSFLVKDTGTHLVEVNRMIFNWRITRSRKNSLCYDRGWCYYGTSWIALLRATQAAIDWDGADDTAPEGWDKNAMTGEYAAERVAGLCYLHE